MIIPRPFGAGVVCFGWIRAHGVAGLVRAGNPYDFLSITTSLPPSVVADLSPNLAVSGTTSGTSLVVASLRMAGG